MYLPHSQKYVPGYLAMNRPDFQEYFEQHHVQLPLRRGDAAFFNPAVFHGAGTNRSADFRRIANLLQISSAFGRAMESVDRARICAAIYPALRAHPAPEHAVAASAEGYAFPTNLDRDQPSTASPRPARPTSSGRRWPRAGTKGSSRRPWPPTAGSTTPTEPSLRFHDGESPLP